MRHSNYFCNTCFKTFTEYWDGPNRYLDNKGSRRVPENHPLTTGKCDNTDQSNHLVKGRDVCGGELKVD